MNIGKYVQLYSEDLRFKNYAKSSIENYCSQVSLFLKDHEGVATKPSEISERQIKEWLLKTNTINSRKHRLSALKLFYKLTGKQPLKLQHIEYPRSDKKLPIVLSVEEIQRMFDVGENSTLFEFEKGATYIGVEKKEDGSVHMIMEEGEQGI